MDQILSSRRKVQYSSSLPLLVQASLKGCWTLLAAWAACSALTHGCYSGHLIFVVCIRNRFLSCYMLPRLGLDNCPPSGLVVYEAVTSSSLAVSTTSAQLQATQLWHFSLHWCVMMLSLAEEAPFAGS